MRLQLYVQRLGVTRHEARSYLRALAQQSRRERKAWRNSDRVSPFNEAAHA